MATSRYIRARPRIPWWRPHCTATWLGEGYYRGISSRPATGAPCEWEGINFEENLFTDEHKAAYHSVCSPGTVRVLWPCPSRPDPATITKQTSPDNSDTPNKSDTDEKPPPPPQPNPPSTPKSEDNGRIDQPDTDWDWANDWTDDWANDWGSSDWYPHWGNDWAESEEKKETATAPEKEDKGINGRTATPTVPDTGKGENKPNISGGFSALSVPSPLDLPATPAKTPHSSPLESTTEEMSAMLPSLPKSPPPQFPAVQVTQTDTNVRTRSFTPLAATGPGKLPPCMDTLITLQSRAAQGGALTREDRLSRQQLSSPLKPPMTCITS